MNYKTILVEISERIALITINRPDKLNAVNLEVIAELENVLNELENNSEVGVLILTGAGEKSFVAGSDISALAKFSPEQAKEYSIIGNRVLSKIQNYSKPVIAAINGFALGSGCEIALACHIRLASENAKFGQPEVNLGLIPGHGGTQRLARIVGIGKAFEMILTGINIDASEALKIGLVNKVVPQAELKNSAIELAKTILTKSPVAVGIAIKAINANLEKSLSQGLILEAELFKECFSTEDFQEGTKAFLEKRKPNFKGK
ncbi:MAG: Enoyl-CoA hydratase [Ignavibacteriae bacterium]|nr:MAG: Enoyl-CoA hydratase [Ignavibacteriota bacterium]